MLDFDTTLELMKKYGFSSTSVHPYIYQNGDSIGICYSYLDDNYGSLERIKIFDTKESLEEFLIQLNWLKINGKTYHVRMILDNYESMNPKVLFLRNEKIMMTGEMFDIDTVDMRESQRKQMDEVSQILYEAGDLFLVYDEVKERQLQYLKKIVELKNTLRQKYFDLQKEIDIYNKVKVERNLTLLPEVIDVGNINEAMEITLKDRYNMYIANRPDLAEIKDFIKEVWDLNLNLELNVKYYEAQKEENDLRNELKTVEQKLALMKNLNDDYKPLFGIDLVSRFRKINTDCKNESNYISENYVAEKLDSMNRKYAVYDRLDLLYTSDYLREAIQNTNYADLAIKYAKGAKDESINRTKLPLNEVAMNLSLKYRDSLLPDEQAILVLYNNHKYRRLCNEILELDNFDQMPINDVIKKISYIKGFSKLKTECYDSVKKRIDDPVNQSIKNSLFNSFDFTSFETFLSSLIKQLVKLRNLRKMNLNSDINMYSMIKDTNEINGKKFIVVTNDLNSLLAEAKENHSTIGIALLKEGLPVMYSPYYFDLGDIYSKGASLQMAIKEMVNFELLIEMTGNLINIDNSKIDVARYYTVPKITENISYVDDIKLGYKTTFCKYAIMNNSLNSLQNTVVKPVTNDTTPTVGLNNTIPNPNPVAVANKPSIPVQVNQVKPEVKNISSPATATNNVVKNAVASDVSKNVQPQAKVNNEPKVAVASSALPPKSVSSSVKPAISDGSKASLPTNKTPVSTMQPKVIKKDNVPSAVVSNLNSPQDSKTNVKVNTPQSTVTKSSVQPVKTPVVAKPQNTVIKGNSEVSANTKPTTNVDKDKKVETKVPNVLPSKENVVTTKPVEPGIAQKPAALKSTVVVSKNADLKPPLKTAPTIVKVPTIKKPVSNQVNPSNNTSSTNQVPSAKISTSEPIKGKSPVTVTPSNPTVNKITPPASEQKVIKVSSVKQPVKTAINQAKVISKENSPKNNDINSQKQLSSVVNKKE